VTATSSLEQAGAVTGLASLLEPPRDTAAGCHRRRVKTSA